MSSIRDVLKQSSRNAQLEEFLRTNLAEAGYGGSDVSKTPMGSSLTLFVTRPGMVIGRRGVGIRALTEEIQEKFNLNNLQISLLEVEVPELHPLVMANRIAHTVSRGTAFRRSAVWAMNLIMNAGASGAEIGIAGKLRSDRANHEKFRAGVVPKSGEFATNVVRSDIADVLLKTGLFGIKVSIALPGSVAPEVELLGTDDDKTEGTEKELMDNATS